ncbi:hypothetical protein B0T37_05965 [Chromobacterium violaceum]|nr:hypothetical protein B0T38_01325 [Chromobacterium violaceum]OQS28402.1 hypothetical protein B0T37_05965 [Chromobacterium violaceum]
MNLSRRAFLEHSLLYAALAPFASQAAQAEGMKPRAFSNTQGSNMKLSRNEYDYRPPRLQDLQTASDPLIVLCTLLARADNSPLSERRRDPGFLIDRDGQSIQDPAGHDQRPAFDSPVNVSFEKWGEYWRKVHGPRFLYAQKPQDGGIQRMVRYDQVHRLAFGPSKGSSLPYLPPVDNDGELFHTVVDHVPAYRRPDWDGIAYLGFKSTDDMGAVFSQPSLAATIIPEDKAIFRELAPVLSRQHIIIPSATQRDPILLVKTHQRRAGLSRQEFQHQWLAEHADLVRTTPATARYVRRYVQLHAIGPEQEGQPFWHPASNKIDGVTLMAFSSLNDLEDFMLSEDYQAIERDEQRFADAERSDFWTAMGINVVNRIQQEVATPR